MGVPQIKSEDDLYAALRDGHRIQEFNQRVAKGEETDLTDCDLRGCDLRGWVPGSLDLRGCYFRNADLRGVDLSQCNLDGASFHEARISGVFFPASIFAAEIEMSVSRGTRVRHQAVDKAA